MNAMLLRLRLLYTRWFYVVSAVAFPLLLSLSIQAQTNFDFNASTDPGWQHWLPDYYAAVDPCYITGANLPSVSFITNDYSPGNMAYFLHAGTSNSGGYAQPAVASIITNGTPLSDFTMTAEFFHWTNGQGQEFGLAGRVQVPWPDVNPQPTICGDSSLTNSYAPFLIDLVYANARSAKAQTLPSDPGGSTDNLRIDYVYVEPFFGSQQISVMASASFSGPGVIGQPPSKPYTGYVVGRSLSPDAANGHYRLILTAVSGNNNGFTNGGFTGQLVDLSTGLPMMMGSSQYIISCPAYYYTSNSNSHLSYAAYLTNNGAIFTNGVLYSGTAPLGSAYGVLATLGSSGSSGYVDGNYTVGQPIDPKFDNYAIVPGVVTLESSANVAGPYAVDPSAGIEVYPKRITVPVNGATMFYRLNWIGCDHTPAITSITRGPTVNVVLPTGASTVATNAVPTVVLGYN